jgi:hypothetical protein
MQVIDVQLGKRGQRVFFKKLIVIRSERLLVDIEIDHTEYQSSAQISRWDGAKWQSVHSLHHTQMEVDFSAAYRKEELTESLVEPVVERLILTAEKVIFGDEKSFLDFLNVGGRVDGLSKDEQRLLREAEAGSSHPRVRITLTNGKSLIAEGPFENVDGAIQVWTPLEPETFALLERRAIVMVAYSE